MCLLFTGCTSKAEILEREKRDQEYAEAYAEMREKDIEYLRELREANQIMREKLYRGEEQ